MLPEQLKNKWNELNSKEEDSFSEWNDYLDKQGLITILTAECHWGKYGVLGLIDELINIINTTQQVVILDDPSAEGTDHFSYLVFPRQ